MKRHSNLIIILAVIVLAALIRLLPHPYNFTPIGALALFSGSLIRKKNIALLALPFGGLIMSDAIMEYIKPGTGFYPGIASVYGSFLLIFILGFFLQSNRSIARVAGFSILSSIVFYLVTNFAFWYGGTLYPLNFSGIMESYYMAIPFFRNGLLGDLLFNGFFFGSYYLLSRKLHLQEA